MQLRGDRCPAWRRPWLGDAILFVDGCRWRAESRYGGCNGRAR